MIVFRSHWLVALLLTVADYVPCITSFVLYVRAQSKGPRLTRKWITRFRERKATHYDGSENQELFLRDKASPNCSYCGATFASRNSLFKHLRSSAECHQRAIDEAGGIPLPRSGLNLTKRTIAIQFGYHPFQSFESNKLHSNEVAAEAVRDAFASTLQEFGSMETLGMTYSSAARLRHVALAQEATCSASSDVVAINYRAAATINGDALRERLQASLRRKLDHEPCGMDVRILGVENVPASVNFHAEKECTQRVYQYLLPLRWFTLGSDAREWLLERPNTTFSGTQRSVHHHRRPDMKAATPVVLLRLKEALLSASSRTAWNRRERRRASFSAVIGDVEGAGDKMPPVNVVTSPGRFGALWRKERRCLHNFADPALRGLASPNTETVWRTIDRARSIDVLGTETEFETDVTLVIELRGDGFLSEEVRRVVASVVAICNGWLPSDFFETATRSDVMIETPVAPEGRIYLSGARYHFQEETDDLNLFNVRSQGSIEWLHELQDRLICCRTSSETMAAEELWLSTLRDEQAPRIRAQLEQVAKDDKLREIQIQGDTEVCRIRSEGGEILGGTPPFEDAPAVYHTTLSLLRQVSGNGQWPATSEARARVIRATRGLVKSSDVRASQAIESGSFTVVNEEIFDGPLPQGNELFPELVTAIFKLEAELARLPLSSATSGCEDEGKSKKGIRPPSSHCAVNRNAEFTPHVDSGRGEGQSLSLIVGLGDYVGGGLVVDGKSYRVRYAPLEFDGWKQIHYTQPFEGEERFSLVWFTPEKRVT